MKGMKNLDLTVWTLLTIGGLNWGLVGFFDFNLVAAIFGPMTRFIYILVGLAAVYDIVAVKAIWRRWDMHLGTPSHA